MEEAGLVSCTTASQQGEMEAFWLHYGELSGHPSFIWDTNILWDTNANLLGRSPGFSGLFTNPASILLFFLEDHLHNMRVSYEFQYIMYDVLRTLNEDSLTM